MESPSQEKLGRGDFLLILATIRPTMARMVGLLVIGRSSRPSTDVQAEWKRWYVPYYSEKNRTVISIVSHYEQIL